MADEQPRESLKPRSQNRDLGTRRLR